MTPAERTARAQKAAAMSAVARKKMRRKEDPGMAKAAVPVLSPAEFDAEARRIWGTDSVTLFDLVTAFNEILDRVRFRDLSRLITERGISARKLADVAGCSVGTVCKVKRGKHVRAQIELEISAALDKLPQHLDERTIPLAVRLSQAIIERGIPARKLAEVAGYSVRTVYNAKQGKPVRDQTSQEISAALDKLLAM
jgi:DNA-binding Xre family transcriptional regulator